MSSRGGAHDPRAVRIRNARERKGPPMTHTSNSPFQPPVPTPYIVPPSRIREVTGVISRSRAYVLEQSDPGFPKRVRLSPSNTGWRYSELIAYIERRAAS